MQLERTVVWLVGLVAIAASVLAYAVPVDSLPADLVVAVLLGIVALPVLFVVGRTLLSLGNDRRGWS